MKNDETELILFYENLKGRIQGNIEVNKFKKLIILIGPEGGFSDEEYSKLKNKSTVLSLGDNILRTETAAICAVHELSTLLRPTP